MVYVRRVIFTTIYQIIRCIFKKRFYFKIVSYEMPLWNSYLIDLTEGHKTKLLISIVRI